MRACRALFPLYSLEPKNGGASAQSACGCMRSPYSLGVRALGHGTKFWLLHQASLNWWGLFYHFSGATGLGFVDAGHEGRTEKLTWSRKAEGGEDIEKPRRQEGKNTRLKETKRYSKKERNKARDTERTKQSKSAREKERHTASVGFHTTVQVERRQRVLPPLT